MVSTTKSRSQPKRQPAATVGVLLALIGMAFALVSTVHFGVDIPLGFATISDPFPGAAPPEAIVAVVVMLGAVAVLTRRAQARGFALTATLFATLATVYGLTITLPSARTGDVTYHLIILVALLSTVGLLLTRRAGEGIDRKGQ